MDEDAKYQSDEFEHQLLVQGNSPNTVRSYGYAVRQMLERVPDITQGALLEYREWLGNQYAIKTANVRINAINAWIDLTKSDLQHLRAFKVQQKPFLDNVISQGEYEHLCSCLLANDDMQGYFLVRFLACTGARVSELRAFTAGSVRCGYLDIVSKGAKLRRVWIPSSLRDDALPWVAQLADEAPIFANEDGEPLSARAISYALKRAGRRFGVSESVVYPHSFRHLFAKNFIARNPDIAFLADLMGHKNIETTRIYLRKTASEQRMAVDETVDW